MEFNELVKIRRSCRSFLDEKVLLEDIKKIMETAVQAPSWKNSQTGRYYVALSDEAIKEVYDDLPDFNQNSSKNAAYIVCTFKKGISGNGDDNWGAYDLGLQNSYMMFQASQLGYDTLIMGLRDEEKLRKYFEIPEDEIMLPVIAIGKRNGDCRLRARIDCNEIFKTK